jgi:glyoxalase family protein
VLERLMGATARGGDTWELRGEARGGTIAYDEPPAEPGRQSAGTVHHVAWGTTVAEHPRWDDKLREAGVPTSGIVDRHYFHSIYFREPSGVLFELADDGPGFTVDGLTYEQLGSQIILPPKLEPHRAQIEQVLTPLPDPRASWSLADS